MASYENRIRLAVESIAETVRFAIQEVFTRLEAEFVTKTITDVRNKLVKTYLMSKSYIEYVYELAKTVNDGNQYDVIRDDALLTLMQERNYFHDCRIFAIAIRKCISSYQESVETRMIQTHMPCTEESALNMYREFLQKGLLEEKAFNDTINTIKDIPINIVDISAEIVERNLEQEVLKRVDYIEVIFDNVLNPYTEKMYAVSKKYMFDSFNTS